MKIYNYDDQGFLISESEAYESPLEPGTYLVPALATIIPPPERVGPAFLAQFNGNSWVTVPNPDYQTPEQREELERKRQEEEKKLRVQQYILERTSKADADIQALLGEMQDTTHLMMSLYDLTIATNVLGNATPPEIEAAKGRIIAALQLMQQVNEIRAQRDADIEAYLAAHPVT